MTELSKSSNRLIHLTKGKNYVLNLWVENMSAHEYKYGHSLRKDGSVLRVSIGSYAMQSTNKLQD